MLVRDDKHYELECLCLDLDLEIDEEEYSFTGITSEGAPLTQLTKRISHQETQETLSFLSFDYKRLEAITMLAINRTVANRQSELALDRECDELWVALLLAKKARAELQSDGLTRSLDELDRVAEFLLRKLPAEPEALEKKDDANAYLEKRSALMRVLYLNEISACYRGFLSIGYADGAITLINKTFGKEKTAYELIAVYNKAQGYFHVGDQREKALRDFEAVDLPSDYYVKDDIEEKPLGAFYERHGELVNQLVVFPAQIMRAECLLKMQRGDEAKRCLEGLQGKPLSQYQEARVRILKLRALSDQGEFPQFEKILSELDANLHMAWGKKNLKTQLMSIKIEASQREADQELRKASIEEIAKDLGKRGPEKLLKSLNLIKKYLSLQEDLVQLIGDQKGNVIDEAQATLLWVKGFKVIKDWLTLVNNLRKHLSDDDKGKTQGLPEQTHELMESISELSLKYLEFDNGSQAALHAKARSIIADKKYRPNQREIRILYLEQLAKINQLLNVLSDVGLVSQALCGEASKAGDLEKQALDELLEKSDNPRLQLSEFAKLRYRQRKELIAGKALFRDIKDVRRFLASEFFGAADKTNEPLKCRLQCAERIRLDQTNLYNCANARCEETIKRRVNVNPACAVDSDNTKNRILHYYDGIIKNNRAFFNDLLHTQKQHPIKNSWGLAVLRRWNSFTPALALSEGGGYFLFAADSAGKIIFGVVIDPGYDFLRNFFAEGFSIDDIDAILVSHDHPDHLDDFAPIVNVKFEAMKNRGGGNAHVSERKITAVLSEGSYKKLRYSIEGASDVFIDTRVIKRGHPTTLSAREGGCSLEVHATPAFHADLSTDCDSIGFRITASHANRHVNIGFTCDTTWDESLAKTYKDCDILCYHAGSITDEADHLFDYFGQGKVDRILFERQHLYLPGTVMFSLHEELPGNQLKIISEFGEELKGGLRVDYATRLGKYAAQRNGGSAAIIPSDTGLLIDALDQTLACICCESFFQREYVEFEAFGPDERLFCICKNCRQVLSDSQRFHKYQTKLNTGRKDVTSQR